MAFLDQRAILLDELTRRFRALRIDHASRLRQGRSFVWQIQIGSFIGFRLPRRRAASLHPDWCRLTWILLGLRLAAPQQNERWSDKCDAFHWLSCMRNRLLYGSFVSPRQQRNNRRVSNGR
jgi:hypothetical protein